MNSEILKQALDKYGIASQTEKYYEEAAELREALLKYKHHRISAEDVITELADVTIMLIQLKMHYGNGIESEAHIELLEHLKKSYKSLTDLYICEDAALVAALHAPDSGELLQQLLEETSSTVSYITYQMRSAKEVIEEIDYKIQRLAKRMEEE